jgi:biotin synthase-related radical SAM superfamily protein
MTEKKDHYLKQLKKEYNELNYRWSRERDKFEADLQHESADVRKEYEAKREEYRKYRKELEEKIVDLDVASDKAWEDMKDGAEKSWKALSQAFDKASSHFKK